jgi:DNA-binding transcriptional LysR family regulator
VNEHLSLHQLKLFCAVVDHGSYVEAAKELFMTQPSLSLQIKSLQKILSTPLFERRGNRLHLTESGKITYEYAKNILLLEQKLKSAIQEIQEGDQGTLSIGCSRTFGRYILLQILDHFLEDNKKVQVSVVHKDTESIYNQVLNKILDVGIITSDESVPLPPGLQVRKFRHDHWCLVSSSQAPWANQKWIHRNLFRTVPLISALKNTIHWRLIQKILFYLNISEEDYCIQLRMEDLEAIKIGVLKGLGIAFLPYTLVQEELERGDLVEFLFPDHSHPPLDCLIVTQKDTIQRPIVQKFIDFFHKTFPFDPNS